MILFLVVSPFAATKQQTPFESLQERARRIPDETRTSAASSPRSGYSGSSSLSLHLPVRSRRLRLINSYLISGARQPSGASPPVRAP